MFVACGAHLIHADQIAHELMQPGQIVYEQVVQHFGTSILNSDGSVNRPKLAEVAFGSPNEDVPSRVEELNRIVHPAVILRQQECMDEVRRQDPAAIAILEAALIIEAGAAKRFDRLVVVTCRPEQRIQRFAHRMNLDEVTARPGVTKRIGAEATGAGKSKPAD